MFCGHAFYMGPIISVKTVACITYTVLVETVNHAQSINQLLHEMYNKLRKFFGKCFMLPQLMAMISAKLNSCCQGITPAFFL